MQLIKVYKVESQKQTEERKVKMKRRIVLCMILGCLSMTLFGCTSKDVMDAVAEKKAANEAQAETEEVEVVDEQKDPLKEPVKSAEEKAKEAEIHAKEAADEKIAKEQIDDKLLEEKERSELYECEIISRKTEESVRNGKYIINADR